MLNCLAPYCGRGASQQRTVEIWLIDVETLEDEFHAGYLQLSPAERTRLESLHFERDRNLYLASHMFLRNVLCIHQNKDPADWQFEANIFGRPAIVQPQIPISDRLQFSLSHSHEIIAVAITYGWQLGVDVERTKRLIDIDLLAPSVLSNSEKHWFSQLKQSEQERAFICLWTIKESLLKAYGVGLSESFKKISILYSQNNPAVLISSVRSLASGSTWSVAFDNISEDFALAVAVQGQLSLTNDVGTEHRRLVLYDLRRRTAGYQGQKALPPAMLSLVNVAVI
jgi:4'-phosphopantetheinyl transferase